MRTLRYALLFCLMSLTTLAQAAEEWVFVGTYSTRGSVGLYVFSFDRATGKLTQRHSVQNPDSPSFIALHPTASFIYVANEAAEVGPKKTGTVAAYRVNQTDGRLYYLGQQSSGGSGPCHVRVSKSGKWAAVSNYGGGSVALFPVQAEGMLGPATDVVKHTGRSANPKRQEAPHVHSATFSPDGRFLYVADLGVDKVFTYEISDAGKLRQVSALSVKPGSGPRHFTIHPNGKTAYLVQELTSSVAVMSRDAATGALRIMKEGINTLPPGFNGDNSSADIHPSKDGHFIYQSNRGADVLTGFPVQPDGTLGQPFYTPTGGKTPRNFTLDPKGEFVLVANQNSDNITVFRRDKTTGKLTPAGPPVPVPAPVCVRWSKPI